MSSSITRPSLRLRLRPLALALTVGLAAPGLAFAQTEKERELEARIAQLEQLVEQLVAERETAPVAPAAPAAAPSTAPAVAQAPAARPIQSTTLTPAAAPGTTIRFGGFVKADFLATRTGDGVLPENSNPRRLYLPGTTPIGGESSDVDYDAHAQFSRFGIGIDTVTDGGNEAGAFIELDFFGSALGNEIATNTYGATIRHAYMSWNNWLAGQTWTNFMDAAVLPEAADFIGPTDGALFARQAQIRYTNGPFSVALENPETTFIPYGGGAVASSDRGAFPDLTLRYGWRGEWGSFGLGGVLRELKVDREGMDDRTFGGGVTAGGVWMANERNQFRYQLTAGRGINRYIGLGITADAGVDADGDLDAIDAVAGFLAWRYAFSPTLRSNLIYARSDYDNDPLLTGGAANKTVQSIRANLFYSPMPRVDVGAELMYGKRKIENGQDGDISRLQFTTRYTF